MSNQGPPGSWQPPGSGGWQPPPSQPPPGSSPQTESTAIVAMVLAALSFVLCPVIPAVIALFLAPSAQRKIAQSGGRLTGEGLAKAAKIIALVNLALWAVIIAIIVVASIFGAGDDEYSLGLFSLHSP